MNIINAAPHNYNRGIRDLSGRIVPVEPSPLSFHIPKFWFYAEKGSEIPELIPENPAGFYGSQTFDKNSKYFNHATLGIITAYGAGNQCMLERIVPDDANPEANFTLYMDVLATDVPNYKRNSDGGIVTDVVTGEPVANETTPTVTGYKVKYIVETSETGLDIGLATTKTGTMDDGAGGASTMYPIMEVKGKYRGSYYNNVGLAVSAMSPTDIATKYLTDAKYMPYEVSLVARANKNSSPVVQETFGGERSVKFSLKKGAIDPITEAEIDASQILPEEWENENPKVESDIGETHFYFDNVETLTTMFTTSELPFINVDDTWNDGVTSNSSTWYDFNTNDTDVILEDETHLFNIISLTTAQNVKYVSVIKSDDAPTLTAGQQEVSLGKDTPIYLGGGSDGTMSEANFEAKVIQKLEEYADFNSRVIDTAINVETMFYDTGFSLDVKKEIPNFISVRKNTGVVISTRQNTASGDGYLSVSESKAVAAVLTARLALVPESSYWGTSVTRGVIISGSGKLKSGLVKDRLPLSLDLLHKAASYMGGFAWKKSKNFDSGNNSIISIMKDIQNDFIPQGAKFQLWESQIVYAMPFDRVNYHYPAVQTVYSDDTSVLNSFPTMMACIGINTMADAAHRAHTGDSTSTSAEFAENVVNFMKDGLRGRFDDRFVIVPKVIYTEADEARGYSFTLETELYANNMKTVMTSFISAKRMSDLA